MSRLAARLILIRTAENHTAQVPNICTAARPAEPRLDNASIRQCFLPLPHSAVPQFVAGAASGKHVSPRQSKPAAGGTIFLRRHQRYPGARFGPFNFHNSLLECEMPAARRGALLQILGII